MPRSVAVITRSLARREAEAVVDLGDRDAERRVAREELLPGRVDVRLVAAAAQELEQHLAMAGRRRREQRSLALLGTEPAVDAIVGGGDAARRADASTPALSSLAQRRAAASSVSVGRAAMSRAQLVRAKERLVRVEDRPLDVAAQLLVALLDQLPRRVERLERARDHDEQRVVAQVVEQRRRRLEEQRQVVLDAGRQLRVGDRAVDRAAARLDRESARGSARETP